MFNWLLKGCPVCGGDLFEVPQDGADCWHCMMCGRSYERAAVEVARGTVAVKSPAQAG